MTLNFCNVPAETRSNCVPNFSEIEQSAAALLRFKYVKFEVRPPTWLFTIPRLRKLKFARVIDDLANFSRWFFAGFTGGSNTDLHQLETGLH